MTIRDYGSERTNDTWVQFITSIKESATRAACARNAIGYCPEYGNSWFKLENNDIHTLDHNFFEGSINLFLPLR